jgi:imidazolonepropionase-like amidohydrolase
MHFPGAPDGMKFACGENPKRVYGDRNSAPSTRMGNVAGYRRAFQDAVEYRIQWQNWREQWRAWRKKKIAFDRARADAGPDAGPPRDTAYGMRRDAGPPAPDDPGPEPPPPGRDFGKDALVGILEGTVLVQNHCYRADEMLRMIALSHEFGFRIRSFHHAVEAYKIRDVLAREGVAVSTWADWWGFKLEAYDSVLESLALLTQAGARAVLHSDSPMYVQRFNQEAAKAMYDGRAAGIPITEDQALRWFTANPAWTLGIDDRTGTLEPGKMADVVVWSASPWSVYTQVDLTYVEGRLLYDRSRPETWPRDDFEVGLGNAP